ncbi:MAG: sulfatase-like hydrolase/transferase, partial [Gammaproteobacteria bacterium]|nr:sulfatase-like hydrolase/transferase [Gammaproteobacteria bacterium]
MSSLTNRKRFPIGLMLFVLTLAIYKAAMLTVSMAVDWRAFLFLVGLDAFFIALFLLLVLFRDFCDSKLLRSTLWLLLVFLSVTYLVDSFVLLALNQHAPLFDMGRYALEPGVVLSFFDIRAYIALVLLLIALFSNELSTPAVRRTIIALLVIVLSTAGFCSLYAPLPLARYAMLSPVNLIGVIKPQPVMTSYSEEQINFYASYAHDSVEIPAAKPDIILLVVESLSSINSTKVSGAVGFMDEFDKLAEEGMLFRNFFANHQASEGGVIALLGGYPPIHFPTAGPHMFDEFAVQPSVMGEYQQLGYFTEFLTNSDLGFIGLNRFLDGLGLDRSRGRDEVEALKDAPRVVQDAPSDALLYEEALLTIQRLSSAQQPFLLTMATASTHLPYTHPENGDNTPQAVWAWCLLQLSGFYQALTETG